MSDRSADRATPPCWLCGSTGGELVAEIRQRPEREPDFGIDPSRYRRAIHRCDRCGVFYSAHELLGDDVYAGTYNASIYEHQLAERYDRVMALPSDQSDNRQRVARVAGFVADHVGPADRIRVLDVGSGLCVFLGGMKEHGFHCTCVDPDPIAARHALEHVGIDAAHAGTLADLRDGERFDVIAFNKVLEHVKDPVRQLRLAASLLAEGGVIYVELPDGEAALRAGTIAEREEFFIDHATIHCADSLTYLAGAADLHIVEMQAIHEPSDKWTLYAFLRR